MRPAPALLSWALSVAGSPRSPAVMRLRTTGAGAPCSPLGAVGAPGLAHAVPMMASAINPIENRVNLRISSLLHPGPPVEPRHAEPAGEASVATRHGSFTSFRMTTLRIQMEELDDVVVHDFAL